MKLGKLSVERDLRKIVRIDYELVWYKKMSERHFENRFKEFFVYENLIDYSLL